MTDNIEDSVQEERKEKVISQTGYVSVVFIKPFKLY